MPSKGARTSVRCELLARGHDPRARRFAIALRRVAPDFDIFHLLCRHHAGLAQLRPCARTALRLLVGLRGRAHRALRGREAVADRSLVESHQQIAALHRVAVFLVNREHHGRYLGAQVCTALGLHRTGDRGAGGHRIAAQYQHIFIGERQRRHGGVRLLAVAPVAAGDGKE
jgi:PAS domain-containing protein